MVRDMGDRIDRLEDVMRRTSPKALEQLQEDIRGRYTNEDLDEIISGEGWANVEAMTLRGLTGILSPLGMTGLLLLFDLVPKVKALVMYAFLSGYEKRVEEEQARELGLGGGSRV